MFDFGYRIYRQSQTIKYQTLNISKNELSPFYSTPHTFRPH